jgi:hypothetical protein
MAKVVYCKYCDEHKSQDDFTKSQLSNKSPKCKDCVKKSNDDYYDKNRKKLQKQATDRYFINSEKRKEYSRNYRKNNSEIVSLGRKKYYNDNKEKEILNHKIYVENNRESVNAQQAIWRLENKEKYQEYNREYSINYRENNKESIAENKREWEKHKVKTDPSFKIKKNLSRAISRGLAVNGTKKNNQSCWNFLGYSIDELKQHLEYLFDPWMTWNNHGQYNPKIWDDNNSATWTWQIDHIMPHSTFKYSSMEDKNFKKCWALENLRPLSAKQNVLDGVFRTRHK